MTLGERVVYFRKAQNLSQDQVAEKAGIKQTDVSRIEVGTTEEPGVRLAAKIAYGLGVSVEDLLSNDTLEQITYRRKAAQGAQTSRVVHLGASSAGQELLSRDAFDAALAQLGRIELAVESLPTIADRLSDLVRLMQPESGARPARTSRRSPGTQPAAPARPKKVE